MQPIRTRIRKNDRREQILLELRLRPHVRIAELADRFGVSAETVRRDVDALGQEGLISRAHGGVSAPEQGQYPGFGERSSSRVDQRERIGRSAAELVDPGDTLMVDSGSTTLQFSRFLAYRAPACTVITNSLPIAMTLGQADCIQVILCPGNYYSSESCVVGTETVEFLGRHSVDGCFIGASALAVDGVFEAVQGFASIKRTMIACSLRRHLLVDSDKFYGRGMRKVSELSAFQTVVVDSNPEGDLGSAFARTQTDVRVAA